MAITFTTKAAKSTSLQSIAGEVEPISLNIGYEAAPAKSHKNVQEEHSTPNTPTGLAPVEPTPKGKAPRAKGNYPKKQLRTQPNKALVSPKTYSESSLNEILGVDATPEPLKTIDPTTHKRIRSTKEAVDFRRKQVLRLVLRGVPKSTIAEHLGLSIGMVYEDVGEMTKDMRSELRAFDYPGYIGMTLAFYDECRNIALRLATDTNEKSNGVKMQALRTAVMTEDSKHTFLAKIGLHKVTSPTDPFNSIQSGRSGTYSDENDINSFLQSIANMSNSNVVDVAPKHADASS